MAHGITIKDGKIIIVAGTKVAVNGGGCCCCGGCAVDPGDECVNCEGGLAGRTPSLVTLHIVDPFVFCSCGKTAASSSESWSPTSLSGDWSLDQSPDPGEKCVWVGEFTGYSIVRNQYGTPDCTGAPSLVETFNRLTVVVTRTNPGFWSVTLSLTEDSSGSSINIYTESPAAATDTCCEAFTLNDNSLDPTGCDATTTANSTFGGGGGGVTIC